MTELADDPNRRPGPPDDQTPREEEHLPQLYREYEPPGNLPALRQPLQGPRSQEVEEEDVISLELVLRTLRRRRWLLLSVAATVLALTIVHVFTATPMYRAGATLQIDPEDAKILPFEEMSSQGASARASEEYLWTQAEKLKSGDLARRVIAQLDLAEKPAFTEPVRKGVLLDSLDLVRKAIGGIFGASPEEPAEIRKLTTTFQDRLEVTPIRNTRLVEISFESPDPELAARVTNTVPEEFIQRHLEGKFDSTIRATDFLRGQLEDLKIQVEQSEEALLEYAQAKNIVNLSDRETSSRKRLSDLTDELTLAQTAMIQNRSVADAATTASLASFPDALSNDTIRRLESSKSALEQELSGISEQYGEGWPEVKELRLRIADLDSQLQREKRRALVSARQNYDLARDRYEKVAAAVAEQRALVERLNQDSIQYNILKREVDSTKELYEGLLQRLKEASVSAGLRSSNIQVTDRAEVPRFAASPRKGRALALGLVLALFLGVGAALVAESLDNTLKSSEDVSQYLGLPSLGTVPYLTVEANGHRHWARLGRTGTAPPKPILQDDADEASRGSAREAYRTLRTSLMLSHSDRPPQAVLVTSALSGEGKSTTAANLAGALAATGESTLLVDADLRKPALAAAFGIDHEQGLTTCLSGASDLTSQILRTVRYHNLYLLPAGQVAPNPPELLGSKRMAQALKLLRGSFTYIVIDSPPTLELSDSRVLARSVDGVILVTRAGKTPRNAVRKAAGDLLVVGGRILGVVLNAAAYGAADYGYGYGYGYGYRSGGYLEPPGEPGLAKRTE